MYYVKNWKKSKSCKKWATCINIIIQFTLLLNNYNSAIIIADSKFKILLFCKKMFNLFLIISKIRQEVI